MTSVWQNSHENELNSYKSSKFILVTLSTAHSAGEKSEKCPFIVLVEQRVTSSVSCCVTHDGWV